MSDACAYSALPRNLRSPSSASSSVIGAQPAPCTSPHCAPMLALAGVNAAGADEGCEVEGWGARMPYELSCSLRSRVATSVMSRLFGTAVSSQHVLVKNH
eukprot:1162016-Pelagomonas_calceolata.AAC.12